MQYGSDSIAHLYSAEQYIVTIVEHFYSLPSKFLVNALALFCDENDSTEDTDKQMVHNPDSEQCHQQSHNRVDKSLKPG